MYKIKQNKESQISVKRSKFLGFCFKVESINQVKDILQSFEGKYKGAKHTVYAYRLAEDGVLREKFDNDGEPTGSAGPPLLSLLQKKNIMSCLLVVVRYYGGINLGVGGLIRAYTQAAQETLEENFDENQGK
ncbi:YigZ family protein [Candidatus Parcubacteria bacterium]|nr:MAG: YigZ family protein [Candidatus Parcubacteria bacterium]